MSIIEDGSGGGYKQKVNGNLRAYTSSTTTTNQEQAAFLANSYHVLTGLVTLTSANESAVLYFKNTSNDDFRIKDIVGGFSVPAGATSGDVALVKLVRNPTAGTIVSDATTSDIRCNRNFGSAKLIQDTADIYKGAEAKTFTDGIDHFLIYAPTNDHFTQLIDEIIPKGKSLGVLVTPPASNSSLSCYVGIIGHYEDPKE